MTPRDRARRLLLELAQLELTGRFDDARALWTDCAAALEAADIGSQCTRELVGRGLVDVRKLLQLALRIVVRCSCEAEIDGLVWSFCELVGWVHFADVDEHFESRRCPACGSTRSVKLPAMRGAA